MGTEAPAAPEAGTIEVASRSGRVEVVARPVPRPEVLDGDATIDASGRVIGTGTGRVRIACPEGADVIVGATSGRIECRGRMGRVAITNTSGRVTVEHARELEVRTRSGRVTVDRCEGLARVVVGSGAVQITAAGALEATTTSGRVTAEAVGDATVRVGSGRVTLGLTGAGVVDIRTQSGRVGLTLPAGVHPSLQLSSRSGRVTSEVEAGTDGSVTVETGSGRIQVTRR